MARVMANPLSENAEIQELIKWLPRPARGGYCMPKKMLIWLFILMIAGLCAWSPWLTQASASRLAETQFNEAWSGVIDGCGISGKDLGAKDFRKVLFGAYVT